MRTAHGSKRNGVDAEDVGGVPAKLGEFLDNTRRRASKLTLERHAELDALGMRW
ncbi:hypothetical protein [Streptomyces mirabilis]|uniref:hypothetical protein n=1 Tax=Streptomyces mirabilis TaxID=68239 RepID=UPI002259662D|nr:hypothetical protein [Streptomyces mirabilis]